MLIRQGGSVSGIKEYLEKGRKAGREQCRDALDQRVILAGDLELADTIIQGMPADKERYLHYTLAFKEDHIDVPTLRSVTQEFESYLMSAYQPDEYQFYAEVHYPKIKSYINKSTGEMVERKPHVHIVIPKENLVSGGYLNPMGLYDQNVKYLEAFQEHINNSYGLASPKDHLRLNFNSQSEMISRYKGDEFKGKNSETRSDIFEKILERKVCSWEAFKAIVAEYGQVKTRNTGKANEYLNIKADGWEKGVNLSQTVFTRAFIELPPDEKRKQLNADLQKTYVEAQQRKSNPKWIDETMRIWKETRAHEIKHINSGNTKLYAHYKQANPEERQQILLEREAKFRNTHHPKHESKHHDTTLSNRTPNHQPNLVANTRKPPTNHRGSLRKLSECGVVRIAKGGEMLLQSDVSRVVVDRGTERNTPVRRSHGHPVTPVGQLKQDALSVDLARKNHDLPEWQTIKRNIDAQQLLNHLSQTHGVNPDKYHITQANDGGDRIQCGTRHYNPSDFLTKELSLPWQEADPILKVEYLRQQEQGTERNLPALVPDHKLWSEFKTYYKDMATRDKHEVWQAQRVHEKSRYAEIKSEYTSKKNTVNAHHKSMPPAERQKQKSLIAIDKVNKELALKAAIAQERQALKDKNISFSRDGYGKWLLGQAQAGRFDALEELRRLKPSELDVDGHPFSAIKRPHGISDVPDGVLGMHPLAYQVYGNGNVAYRVGDVQLFTDGGKKIIFQNNHKSDDAVEAALRLGMLKWGKCVEISGSQEFKAQCVKIAAERGIGIEFTDLEMNTLVEQRRAELNIIRQQEAMLAGIRSHGSHDKGIDR